MHSVHLESAGSGQGQAMGSISNYQCSNVIKWFTQNRMKQDEASEWEYAPLPPVQV